ncbi:hypothetical protein glysoja_018303 [Glycine soja]|nr:hypothetical protein glysoja_018303 [Glycine soja]
MVMAWKWIVRRTRESKPFFLAFATICGVVPGAIGYGVMQLLTNTRNEKLESHLRTNARPESLCIFSRLLVDTVVAVLAGVKPFVLLYCLQVVFTFILSCLFLNLDLASPGAAVKLCLGDLLVMGSNPETASLHMQGLFALIMYQMMGQVNKERLAEYLGELQRKEDTNDRYVAALRGETLTRKPYVRIQPIPEHIDTKANKEQKN